MKALEETFARPCQRRWVRLQRHVVPGEKGPEGCFTGSDLRLLLPLCIPDPGRPVRELVAAVLGPPGDTGGRGRAFAGLLFGSFENNIYAQIGLVMLIGLAAKNAILIVEFAKMEYEKGKPLVEATLEGAKLRLRRS